MNILILASLFLLITCMSYWYAGGGYRTSFFDKEYTTIGKGIAILLILMSHCSGHWDGGRFMTPCGGIGVSVFLIISGYGLNESFKRSGLKNFWQKRLGRVYLPYVIAVVCLTIFNNWSITDCLLNISCLRNPYWFVTYILVCYVIFWIVSRFMAKYRMMVMIILSLISLISLPALQAEQSFGFITGVLLSSKKEILMRFRENRKSFILTVITLGLIGILFLTIKQIPIVRNDSSAIEMNIIECFIKYPLGLFFLFSITFAKRIQKIPFLHLTGLISYELYLVHFPFYIYVQDRLWAALILVLASYVIAYIFYGFNNMFHRKIIL